MYPYLTIAPTDLILNKLPPERVPIACSLNLIGSNSADMGNFTIHPRQFVTINDTLIPAAIKSLLLLPTPNFFIAPMNSVTTELSNMSGIIPLYLNLIRI